MLHDIINNTFARKAIEKGADGLIAVAAGAGGHAGVKSPFALIAGDPRVVRRPARALAARSPPAARCWPRRRWAPTSPTSARPSSPPRRRARSDAYKQMIVDGTQRRHRLLEPVHRRARQLPEGLDPQRRPRPGQPARERPEQDELRRRRGARRPGRTSGAAARASARSRRSCRRAELVARLAREYEARAAPAKFAASALRTLARR